MRRVLPAAIPALAAGGVGAALIAAVLALPTEPRGLAAQVEERLAESGVVHPVTAVLLNFRAYDTWLEVAVLFAAAAATLAARDGDAVRPRPVRAGVVVRGLAERLVPAMGLIAVYLLSTGTHGPGGAFQAAAVLAAASILLMMAGYHWPGVLSIALLWTALAAGTAAFLAMALAGPLAGRLLLELPPGAARGLIVAVEVVLAVSIAVTLAFLFLGAAPARGAAPPRDAEPAE